MRNEDRIRLRHMLDAGREAMGFAVGRTRGDLDTDRQFVLAVVKCVEILGEAAGSVSPETRQRVPQIPWTGIINMRHRLVHGYFKINLDIVWQTIQNDLPILLGVLEKVLAREGK